MVVCGETVLAGLIGIAFGMIIEYYLEQTRMHYRKEGKDSAVKLLEALKTIPIKVEK